MYQQGSAPYYRSDRASLYPSLPSSGQGLYTSAHRDHTPTYAADSASVTSSLSPISSHIATPASSSPAHTPHQQPALDRGYLSMQSDRPRGAEDDPNSYSYLAQGSTLAGSKRGHDAVATASFFDDIRRKRLAPTYDMAMAERMEDTFAHGIDDHSLQALFSSFSSSMDRIDHSLDGKSSSADSTSSESVPPQSRLSLPDAFKQTDLADLNAFLLQIGASAARDEPSQGSSSTSFDFAAALNTYGLDNVPGFDESLLQWPQEQQDPSSLHHRQSAPAYPVMNSQWSSHSNSYGQRPIAHLPQRNGSMYPSIPQQQQQQPTHQAPINMYNHLGMPAASFDSLRAARGTAFVPQLGPKDMSGSLYRHVEALTRAKPMEQDLEDVKSFDKRSSIPSSPSMARVSSGDPSRRLPSPTSHERGAAGSIASILDSPLNNRPREVIGSPSSGSSPSPPSSNHEDSSGSSPTIAHLPLSSRRQNSINGIDEDVAAMGVTPDASPAAAIPLRVRQNHAKIVLDLLMAINFPDRRQMKLPPIKVAPASPPADDTDMARTPTSTTPAQAGSEEVDDEADMQQSTPKLATLRTLPNIASLLNDVDEKIEGNSPRRMMDVDV
jgi:hypothetical protein